MDEAYIIGCGPSMSDFEWERLRGLPTIAVNGAIQQVPEPPIFLTACSAFATSCHRSGFWNTRARKVLIMGKTHRNYWRVLPFIDQFDDVYEPARYDGHIGFTWDAFATGRNSGFCAMQYAVLKGARVIHMVGFDLGGNGHYYNEGGPSRATLDNFLIHFRIGIKILLEHNIRVVSHTTASRLNDLIPYEEL